MTEVTPDAPGLQLPEAALIGYHDHVAECVFEATTPYPEDATRYYTADQMREMYQRGLAARPLPSDWVAVPDGWKLVPARMELTPENMETLVFMLGGDPDAKEADERWNGGTLWVGETIGDNGEKYYGLNVANVECYEEGSVPIVEFAAAPSAPAEGGECTGCRGNGEIGGLTPTGYDSQQCPFCKGSGVDEKFEAYVQGLIASAPNTRKLGERLADWLDEDRFNSINPMLLALSRLEAEAKQTAPEPLAQGACPKCRGTGETCTGTIDGVPELFDCNACLGSGLFTVPVGATIADAAHSPGLSLTDARSLLRDIAHAISIGGYAYASPQPAAEDARKFRRLAQLLDGFDFRLGRNALMPPATYLDSVEITCEFQPGVGQSVIDAIVDLLATENQHD